jgi:alkanesulfonate monooxygenase SsuD/methylene tetrahydromethanopterin reductase-like flavin-dependent oxidoreductase (luciferase family)
VEVGIGAGWNEPEYRRAGLVYDRAGIRIERMTEAIAVLRRLFADGPFSFDGRYYTITEMDGQPKPVQRPHPPFLIGGTREKVLRIAASEADIVGLDLRQRGEAILDAFEARTDVRIGWIRDAAGERLGRQDKNVLRVLGDLTITPEPLKAAAELARRYTEWTGQSITAHDILESPFSLIGTVPDLVDKLRRARERWGINSYLVGWFDEERLHDIVPVIEQLA